MTTGDDIGSRGEAIFYVRMTDPCGRKRPFFRPHSLGEKFATLDYLVELLDSGQNTPYFFVQVKATSRGYTKRSKRLKVSVSARDIRRMVCYPAPTYLVGIDERNESGYLAAIHEGMKGALSGLPTEHPLECRTLRLLWDEVRDYWDQRDMSMKQSAFSIVGN